MNALVDYGSSSEEESDIEDDELVDESNIKISNIPKSSLQLPAPKVIDSSHISDDEEISDIKFSLPQPSIVTSASSIKEEDDEFLKKKAIPSEKPPTARQPVKIRIPSLASFNEDESSKKKNTVRNTSSIGGLLSLLPKPKSEILFTQTKPKNGEPQKSNPFIPHSVVNRSKTDPSKKKHPIKSSTIVGNYCDSDDSDQEVSNVDSEDFFSLNKEDKLPEVSINEIHAMVAKKAAQIASTASKFMSLNEQEDESQTDSVAHVQQNNVGIQQGYALEEDAIKQLIGNKRKKTDDINIIEISHDQVMPNRDDWMRNALASSTQYVPKGKLADDDLLPGSKRKHQITYLAHQAKANEAELQAMWAANRQSRRQTQSKYGF